MAEHWSERGDGTPIWHIWLCRECRSAWLADRLIRRRLRRAFRVAAPPGLEERILEALGFPPGAGLPARRGRPSLLPRGRAAGRLALAGAALLAAIVLFYLAAAQSPAQALERVLAAMAAVRTARCSGWFVSYEYDPPGSARRLPGRMKVKWWYRAPDRFRREMGPAVPGWHFPPGTLIVHGREAAFQSGRAGERRWLRGRRLRPHDLSPVDFFAREGFLQRAARERRARVRDEVRESAAGATRVLTVEYDRTGERFPMRERWILEVERATDRIARAGWSMEYSDGSGWRPGGAETLERFEYNLPVPDRLFRIDEAQGGGAPRRTPQGERGPIWTRNRAPEMRGLRAIGRKPINKAGPGLAGPALRPPAARASCGSHAVS